MSRSDLRRLLDDELHALSAPMRTLEEEARSFYEHPDSPALSVWANYPALTDAATPPDGTVTERASRPAS